MPYEAFWEEKGIYWKFKGVLTGGELLQANMDIYGDPRFDRMLYQINDLLDVETFDVAAEIMEEITIMDFGASQTNPRLLVAVVATHEGARRLNDLYETAVGSAPWETKLFESVEEARAWIAAKHRITFE
jgi:hypothetical protein